MVVVVTYNHFFQGCQCAKGFCKNILHLKKRVSENENDRDERESWWLKKLAWLELEANQQLELKKEKKKRFVVDSS